MPKPKSFTVIQFMLLLLAFVMFSASVGPVALAHHFGGEIVIPEGYTYTGYLMHSISVGIAVAAVPTAIAIVTWVRNCRAENDT